MVILIIWPEQPDPRFVNKCMGKVNNRSTVTKDDTEPVLPLSSVYNRKGHYGEVDSQTSGASISECENIFFVLFTLCVR